ncbi:MAG TPA: hypothetical protein VGK94_12790 [Candidatus Polarisedimenticolia bacterium]|jgi:hypothetical protein
MTRAGLSIGDLVVLDSEAERGVGLVADVRRADCRVLYLRVGQALWARHRDVRRAPPAEVEGSLEALVAELLVLLAAAEMEFTAVGDDRYRLCASHGPIAPEVIDEARARLGPRLRGALIRPQGMHRIQTVLEFTFPRQTSPSV